MAVQQIMIMLMLLVEAVQEVIVTLIIMKLLEEGLLLKLLQHLT